MRKLLFILLFLSTCLPIWAQQKQTTPQGKQALLNYIESLKKDEDLKDALWSVKVVDCSTKKSVVEYQASKNLMPASILKLVTTGTGVLTFGNNHTFNTILAYSGNINSDSILHGDIYIIGGGDPTFGSKQFPNSKTDSIFSFFLKSLKQKGIRSIKGKFIADVSLYEDKVIHDTWEWGDIGNYYGAGTSALSFCENMFNITLKPGSIVGQEASIGLPTPFLPDAVINKHINTSSKDSSANVLIYSSPMAANEYWLSGTIPVGCDSVIVRGAIQNPALIALQNLDTYLNNNGVSTSHLFEIKKDVLPLTLSDTIILLESPVYKDIAENTNRFSNNMFAETILKNVAANKQGLTQVSFDNGVKELINILNKKGIDTKNIRIQDGSGLSRQNMLSADFMCNFLLMMYGAYPDFEKLMPSPGEKGTLAGFMNNYKKSRNKAHLKSGSMTGVLNYSGYVKNKSGNALCITVMTNNFTCKVSKVRPKLEKLVHLITECE